MIMPELATDKERFEYAQMLHEQSQVVIERYRKTIRILQATAIALVLIALIGWIL